MTTLALLTEQLLQAKQLEADAMATRRKIEADIVKLLPATDEGTVNQDEGSYRISVRYGMTRKVDTGALRADWNTLGVFEQSAFAWEAKLKLKDYRALEKNPAALAKASKYVTATPSKPSVSIKAIEDKEKAA